jgi:hypothetical protein
LLLTATPHHGDEDRFAHFLRLIDPDLFPEPHRVGPQAATLRRDALRLGDECPWALRRLKEDLKDVHGRRLFPDRHAATVTFRLTEEEYALYKAVTGYINTYMAQQVGQRRHSAALARTVLQRRLASSANAIHESLLRRLRKQGSLLEELEGMTPAQRSRRLASLQGRLPDAEQDEDDLDEADRDQLVDEYTAAVELDQLRSEIAALEELAEQARRVRAAGRDSKLAALRDCLQGAQFAELHDGRGKLLVFTEHRDTLTYLRQHLSKRGSPHPRRALYLATHSAHPRHPDLHAYLERKLAEGKPYKAAVVATAHKLLARIYAVLKRGRPYVVRAEGEVSHAPSTDLDIS